MTQRDISITAEDVQAFLSGQGNGTGRVTIDPDRVEQDLARLVLGLMEFLRQLMELQAIRRLEAGELTGEQQDMLGTTLMRSEAAILEMAEKFGLPPDALSLDLGPLGKTI